jgi:hypothetical protein
MAKESHSRGHAAMSGGRRSKPKSGGKKPHTMTIRHGKSGGHIVTHHFLPDETGAAPEPEDHVIPDKAALLAHIDQNTPDQPAPTAAPPDAGGEAQPQVGL